MKSTPNNGFRRKNNCPYCGYFCDAHQMIEDERIAPQVGDLTFCLMCCEPSQFDNDMKMEKFDLNSIDDISERNRLKGIKINMENFWKEHPHISFKREKYIRDKK